MTATLAEYLDTTNAHMAVVRDAYARTKADHALDDGCDRCTLGASIDRITGWGFHQGDFLCPACLVEAKRHAAQIASAATITVCANGHDLTNPENLCVWANGDRAPTRRCRPCHRDTVNQRRRDITAAKRAASA